MPDFLFAGYLVQEPYLTNWPRREGMKVATIEREVHPRFQRRWEQVRGVANTTEFHTALPQEPEPGWVINAYSVERDAVETVRWSKVDDGGQSPRTFAYALYAIRADDGLKFLGYEVVDAEIERLSILNNCGYTVEQVSEMAGPLNEYSLFSSVAHAERFKEVIKTDPKNPGIIPDHNRGVIVEVWGRP
jgi:hypothetical protein